MDIEKQNYNLIQTYRDQGNRFFNNQKYTESIECYSKALNLKPMAILYQNRAACYYNLQKYQESLSDCTQALSLDPTFFKAMKRKALSLFKLQKTREAFEAFQKCRQTHPREDLGPEFVQCRDQRVNELKNEGKRFIEQKDYQRALRMYENCLGLNLQSQELSKIHANISFCYMNLNKDDEAMTHINKSLELDPKFSKQFARRADLHLKNKNYTAALQDLKTCYNLNPSDAIKQKIQKCKQQVSQAQKKDYYAILGLQKGCTDSEIKKAFHKLSLKWHPDKHSGEKEKEEAKVKFKEINDAYSVLKDKKKRELVDQGIDPENREGGFTGDEMDIEEMFGKGGFGGFGGEEMNGVFKMFQTGSGGQGMKFSFGGMGGDFGGFDGFGTGSKKRGDDFFQDFGFMGGGNNGFQGFKFQQM